MHRTPEIMYTRVRSDSFLSSGLQFSHTASQHCSRLISKCVTQWTDVCPVLREGARHIIGQQMSVQLWLLSLLHPNQQSE